MLWVAGLVMALERWHAHSAGSRNVPSVPGHPRGNDPTGGSGAGILNLFASEYSGADTASPLDLTTANTDGGTQSTTMSSRSATTTNAYELLYGFGVMTNVNPTPESGWTALRADGGFIPEYRKVSAIGSYAATATIPASWWSMQMATLGGTWAGFGVGLVAPSMVARPG